MVTKENIICFVAKYKEIGVLQFRKCKTGKQKIFFACFNLMRYIVQNALWCFHFSRWKNHHFNTREETIYPHCTLWFSAI